MRRGRAKEVLTEWAASHRRELVALAQKYAGRSKTAEDIVQEALCVAWRSAGNLRSNAAVGSWLKGIVRNVGRKALDKRRRRCRLMEENRFVLTPDLPKSPRGHLGRED